MSCLCSPAAVFEIPNNLWSSMRADKDLEDFLDTLDGGNQHAVAPKTVADLPIVVQGIDKTKYAGPPRKKREEVERADAMDGCDKQQPLPLIVPEIPEEDKTLFNLISDGEDPKFVYDRVSLEIAEEAMHLKHLRQAAQAAGIPFSKISRDRVASLKELSDIMAAKAKELAAKGQAGGGSIDFGSIEFRRVMKYIIDQVMESAKSAAIPDHSIKLFASGLQQRMNGFEAKALELYTGSSSKKKEAMNSSVEL